MSKPIVAKHPSRTHNSDINRIRNDQVSLPKDSKEAEVKRHENQSKSWTNLIQNIMMYLQLALSAYTKNSKSGKTH